MSASVHAYALAGDKIRLAQENHRLRYFQRAAPSTERRDLFDVIHFFVADMFRWKNRPGRVCISATFAKASSGEPTARRPTQSGPQAATARYVLRRRDV